MGTENNTKIDFSPLASVGGLVANAFVQDKLNDRQNARQQSNMGLAYQQAQAAQRNAAANEVVGMRAAGLNPATIGDGHFQASLGSASAASASPSPSMQLAQDIQAVSNSRLMDAEARKANAEANRMEHEDNSSNQTLKSFAEHMLSQDNLSDDAKAYWASVVRGAEAGDYNLGDVQSQKNFENLVSTHADSSANVYVKAYEQALHKAFIDNDIMRTNVRLKEGELKQLILNLSKLSWETIKLQTSSGLDNAKSTEAVANMHKLIAEANSIYHGDIAALFANGDYQAIMAQATKYATQRAFDTGMEILEMKAAPSGYLGKRGGDLAKSFLDKVDKSANSPTKLGNTSLANKRAKAAYEQARKHSRMNSSSAFPKPHYTDSDYMQ